MSRIIQTNYSCVIHAESADACCTLMQVQHIQICRDTDPVRTGRHSKRKTHAQKHQTQSKTKCTLIAQLHVLVCLDSDAQKRIERYKPDTGTQSCGQSAHDQRACSHRWNGVVLSLSGYLSLATGRPVAVPAVSYCPVSVPRRECVNSSALQAPRHAHASP